MKNRLFPILLISLASLNSCSKIECTIQNPFTEVAIANYKCAKDCKTEDELKNSVSCVRCVSASLDTTATCDKTLIDSLTNYYQANPTAGKCFKVDPIVLCNK